MMKKFLTVLETYLKLSVSNI